MPPGPQGVLGIFLAHTFKAGREGGWAAFCAKEEHAYPPCQSPVIESRQSDTVTIPS